MRTVIGIGGQKRAGKSTLSQALGQAAMERGWSVEEISFAQPIKDMLAEVFRYEIAFNTFTDDSKKLDKVEVAPGVYMTVREMLQKVGTDCFRNIIHKDFWVARGMAKIKACSADLVLIPDVRFANELVPLQELGHTVFVAKLCDTVAPADTHPSETGLLEIRSDFEYMLIAKEGDTEILTDWAKAFISRL